MGKYTDGWAGAVTAFFLGETTQIHSCFTIVTTFLLITKQTKQQHLFLMCVFIKHDMVLLNTINIFFCIIDFPGS